MNDESNNDKKVFIDFGIRNKKIGRIEFILFESAVPKTVNNFIALITHQKGFGYKGCPVHRIVPGFVIQAGDFTRGDGSGGHSIYGKYFEDENFEIKHTEPGLLSMANAGPDTNGSQFFITLDYTPWLDGKHVVFGKISNLKGLETMRKIERFGSEEGTPLEDIKIINCGLP